MLYLICEPRNKSICSIDNATSSMPLKCPQKHAYQQILLPEKVLDEMEQIKIRCNSLCSELLTICSNNWCIDPMLKVDSPAG